MKTLIKNVRALLPDGTTPLTNIMIDRDKIAAIGEVPDGFRAAKVIDGTGKFAVPGFINAHTHARLDDALPQLCGRHEPHGLAQQHDLAG